MLTLDEKEKLVKEAIGKKIRIVTAVGYIEDTLYKYSRLDNAILVYYGQTGIINAELVSVYDDKNQKFIEVFQEVSQNEV